MNDEKVKATGKIYNAQAEHLWTFNNYGKIIDFQQYIDAKKYQMLKSDISQIRII